MKKPTDSRTRPRAPRWTRQFFIRGGILLMLPLLALLAIWAEIRQKLVLDR